MFEKPQKAQVVRIGIEAVSLDSTSMAPSLMDRAISPMVLQSGRCAGGRDFEGQLSAADPTGAIGQQRKFAKPG